jgi:hypothetical protein
MSRGVPNPVARILEIHNEIREASLSFVWSSKESSLAILPLTFG